jgi:molecular chaperone DnaK
LSEEEVKRMMADAEAHRDEDRKFHELVDVRNKAENLIHGTTKSMTELGDKLEAGEKKRIEDAIAALKEALKGDQKDAIDAKTNALGEASAKMAERLYAQKEKAEAAAGGSGGAAGAKTGGGQQGGAKDDVVDAEFEEVHDNKK